MVLSDPGFGLSQDLYYGSSSNLQLVASSPVLYMKPLWYQVLSVIPPPILSWVPVTFYPFLLLFFYYSSPSHGGYSEEVCKSFYSHHCLVLGVLGLSEFLVCRRNGTWISGQE